jgi:hypothetical protein
MAFASYRAITIPAANIPGSQTDYPFLFTGTYAFLIDAAHGGTVRSAVGNDIVFATDTAGTAVLDFERVFYRASDGYCEFHVRTQPAAGADYILYVCFDDASVSGYLGNNSGTWASAYRAVWHFGDGVTLSGADSTANANTGTATGGPTAVTGQLTGGASFTSTSAALNLVNTTSLRVQTPFGFRFWVFPTSYNTNHGFVMYLKDTLGNFNYGVAVNPVGKMAFVWVNGSFTPLLTDTTVLALNTWSHVDIVVTGTTVVDFYINGVHSSTQTSGISVPAMTTGGNGQIGNDGGAGNALDGAVDELMLYNGTLSANLRAMLYANEFSPATFYNVTTAIAWTSECTIPIVVGFTAHGTAAYGPSCAIPIGVGCGASTSIGYGGAACTITIGAGVSAHATVDYESAKCTIPIVVHVGAIASIGTVPLTCLTGSGTGAAVIPPGVDPGWAY